MRDASTWPARALTVLVKCYQVLFSPWLGNGCRFSPTCSRYAIQALEAHGALAGSYLALVRLGRCHPWCSGGEDPVPTVLPKWPWRCNAPASGRAGHPAADTGTRNLPE